MALVKDLKIALSAWADTLAEPLAELREAGSLAETHVALDRLRMAATEVEGRLRGAARELGGGDERHDPLPDCGNRFGVGRAYGGIRVSTWPRDPCSIEDALLMAAWLVAATGQHERFAAILKEVGSL